MYEATDPHTYETTEEPDRERFKIEDDSQATWAMRKAATARARLHDIELISESEIARIQGWAEHESRDPLRDLAYFEAILIEYAMKQRAEGRKTVSTPYGSVKSRAGQPKYVFVDKAGFLDWARQSHPDWIAIKEEPSLTAIKDSNVLEAVDPETGEMIPGLEVQPATVNFTVEVSK